MPAPTHQRSLTRAVHQIVGASLLAACCARSTLAQAEPVNDSPIAAVTPTSLRPVPLRHAKTGETYQLMLLDEHGRLREEVRTQVRDFLACSKTSNDHPIHPRLLSLLHAISAAYPGRRLIVHSGYRDPSVSVHAKRSNHTRGRALDFRVEGVSNRELMTRLRLSFTSVGVGFYPNSLFVHLDVREHTGFWIDYAGPGDSACYSPHAQADLESGVAFELSPEQAKARGCARRPTGHVD